MPNKLGSRKCLGGKEGREGGSKVAVLAVVAGGDLTETGSSEQITKIGEEERQAGIRGESIPSWGRGRCRGPGTDVRVAGGQAEAAQLQRGSKAGARI